MNLIQQMSKLASEYDARVGVVDERDRHRELAQVWQERLDLYRQYAATEQSPRQRDHWLAEVERAERVLALELELCK